MSLPSHGGRDTESGVVLPSKICLDGVVAAKSAVYTAMSGVARYKVIARSSDMTGK